MSKWSSIEKKLNQGAKVGIEGWEKSEFLFKTPTMELVPYRACCTDDKVDGKLRHYLGDHTGVVVEAHYSHVKDGVLRVIGKDAIPDDWKESEWEVK